MWHILYMLSWCCITYHHNHNVTSSANVLFVVDQIKREKNGMALLQLVDIGNVNYGHKQLTC